MCAARCVAERVFNDGAVRREVVPVYFESATGRVLGFIRVATVALSVDLS